MFETFLVPEKTAVTTKGDGPLVDISVAQNRVFLLQFDITGVVEQESLDLSIFGGADEAGLGKTALMSFPQSFYRGQQTVLLDLRERPDVKVLRAHWEVNRWGRGPETAWFELCLKATEVAPELLRERDQRLARA